MPALPARAAMALDGARCSISIRLVFKIPSFVLLLDRLTLLVPAPALLLAVAAHVNILGAWALEHLVEPTAGHRALDRLVGELAPTKKGGVVLLQVFVDVALTPCGNFAEVHHLVGAVEAIRVLGPVGAIREVDDHARDVVTAILGERLVNKLCAHDPEIRLCIGRKISTNQVGDLLVSQDVPEAVAGEDDNGARLETRDLVDVGNAGHFLISCALLRRLLVLEVAHATAHSQVAIQSGRVVHGDVTARSLDPCLLGRMVWLVVDSDRDQRPRRQVFRQVTRASRLVSSGGGGFLLGGRRNDQTTGITAIRQF
mmetsp:Transcript_68150/g.142384  ORF Transcript_68150/g.142384 Transcript_68150/m.142384 type:complete len:313 (+) Transcript_68150:106-1044(+)